ncbi:LIC_13246 family protein [Leptospira wolffii]|uniref:LIC_13246 family protein n=1 Tax=Leptospira wolffii TaxID=409998 RepID=A0ABV5BXF3_9LEPT
MKDNQWKQLDSVGIDHFRKIQHLLNTFYKEVGFHQKKELAYFKNRLVTEENVKIFIKKIRNGSEDNKYYEYLIYSEMILVGMRKECENWIHIDGIQVERDDLRGKGIIDHPAFEINCVTDLYKEYAFHATEDQIQKLKDLK